MSELFMECEEEELEPWQKQIPEVNLVDDNDDYDGGGDDDDDDDEPIFVGELTTNQRNNKTAPVKRNLPGRPSLPSLVPRPAKGPAQMIPSNVYMPGKGINSAAPSAPAMTTITPQPVIVNNQGFIVTPSELSTNRELITALGKQYPPGTTFTIFPAGQPQLLQPMSQASVLPGVVHRPQVQQINNNIVTLSNVQSPASYSAAKPNQPMLQTMQSIKTQINRIEQTPAMVAKRKFVVPQQSEPLAVKRPKIDLVPPNVVDLVENASCPRCDAKFQKRDALKYHMKICTASPPVETWTDFGNKRIMLVSDFYYGRYDGDPQKQLNQKTNTTFKCQSCLKILKNNIRFMNHMKHHLELEKQNSESYESHTTCQHCYRQYSTPFQLQCHIESAHTQFESSTNCKICELAFESEQVLLEHMKDTHKPGEMPYGCMVCDFRSSFFSDVENHFRTAHENTKDLLCPFCLKVHKTTHTYMNHYMKHQKKGIHRCGKCRLNFLTYKERVDHKAGFHKTFRKPKALEGLPAGTKVTIRASFAGAGNLGKAPESIRTPEPYVSPEKIAKPPVKFQSIIPKPVSNVAVLEKVEKTKTKSTETKKTEKRKAKTNLVLKNLRSKGGHYTCIECQGLITDFFSHYPVMVNCGACKYQTSCKESFANHMIRFHSSIKKDRKWKTDHRKSRNMYKSTLVCLKCDFTASETNGDAMTKHLIERPSHVCKVQEKVGKDEATRLPALVDPTEVLFMFASTPAAGPKVTDTAHEETTVEETNEALIAGQHSVPAEPILVEDDAEEQPKPSELLRPSSPMDGTLGVDPSEQSLGGSVEPDVGEQATAIREPPVSLPVLEPLSNHIVVLDDPEHDSDTPHVEPENVVHNIE